MLRSGREATANAVAPAAPPRRLPCCRGYPHFDDAGQMGMPVVILGVGGYELLVVRMIIYCYVYCRTILSYR